MSVELKENILAKRISAKAGGAIGEAALNAANDNGAQPRMNIINTIEDGDEFKPELENFFAEPFGTSFAYGFVVETTNPKRAGKTVKLWYLSMISKSFKLVDQETKQPVDEWAVSDGTVYDLFVNYPTISEAAKAIVAKNKKIKVNTEVLLGEKLNFRTDKTEIKKQTKYSHNFV